MLNGVQKHFFPWQTGARQHASLRARTPAPAAVNPNVVFTSPLNSFFTPFTPSRTSDITPLPSLFRLCPVAAGHMKKALVVLALAVAGAFNGPECLIRL
jgi:hypothetical protein